MAEYNEYDKDVMGDFNNFLPQFLNQMGQYFMPNYASDSVQQGKYNMNKMQSIIPAIMQMMQMKYGSGSTGLQNKALEYQQQNIANALNYQKELDAYNRKFQEQQYQNYLKQQQYNNSFQNWQMNQAINQAMIPQGNSANVGFMPSSGGSGGGGSLPSDPIPSGSAPVNPYAGMLNSTNGNPYSPNDGVNYGTGIVNQPQISTYGTLSTI